MRFLANRRLIFVLAVLAWLEVSMLPYFAIRTVQPSLFFIFLVFYAFRVNWKHVMALAFVLGLSRDCVTNTFFGLETASYTAAAVYLEFLAIRLDREKPWLQLAGLFSFSWLALLVFSFLLWVVQPQLAWSGWWFAKTVLIAGYTTLVASAVLPLLERWLRPRLRARQYELF